LEFTLAALEALEAFSLQFGNRIGAHRTPMMPFTYIGTLAWILNIILLGRRPWLSTYMSMFVNGMMPCGFKASFPSPL
jgi:hypothetical protein